MPEGVKIVPSHSSLFCPERVRIQVSATMRFLKCNESGAIEGEGIGGLISAYLHCGY
jgi:hypothetical protein